MLQVIGRAVLALVLVTSAGLASESWTVLAGDVATKALSGRSLGYAGGAKQMFFAGGKTDYHSDRLEEGRWRIEGAQYCSQWPPSDRWACYGLEQSADGASVRFIAANGEITVGRYLSD
ncbi:MAG: hypothetical protein WA784_04975 [Albidovulum sp.]